MKQRKLVILAWGLWVLAVVMVALAVVLTAIYAPASSVWETNAAYAVSYTAFAAVGALITTRQPGNRVGWIFSALGVGAGFALLNASCDDALQVLAGAGSSGVRHVVPFFLTPQVVAATDVLGNITWSANIILAILLLLVFPTGRLLSPRWRVLIVVIIVATVVETLQGLVTPMPLADGLVANPFAVPALSPVLDILTTVLGFVMLLIVGATVVSVIVRFVRSRGVERQQLKVFTYGTIVMVALLVADTAVVGGNADIGFALLILILPLTVAVAVLRYRLYDIDIIINRTLVYGSLTALLAGLYFGSVVLLQTLSRAVTGQRGESALAIVVSTLLIAALFQPLRVRLQRTIDRRFYRHKYDAAKTLAQFAATLRGEVDIADLERHLVGVVEETMRPAHVSLWLRPDVSANPRQ